MLRLCVVENLAYKNTMAEWQEFLRPAYWTRRRNCLHFGLRMQPNSIEFHLQSADLLD